MRQLQALALSLVLWSQPNPLATEAIHPTSLGLQLPRPHSEAKPWIRAWPLSRCRCVARPARFIPVHEIPSSRMPVGDQGTVSFLYSLRLLVAENSWKIESRPAEPHSHCPCHKMTSTARLHSLACPGFRNHMTARHSYSGILAALRVRNCGTA